MARDEYLQGILGNIVGSAKDITYPGGRQTESEEVSMRVYMVRQIGTSLYLYCFEGNSWVPQIDGTQWTDIERIHKEIGQVQELLEIVAFDLIEDCVL